MGILDYLVKATDSEKRSRAILSACENPHDSFPSCAEEYDIAAFLYDFYSKDDESYKEKAYFNALRAIKEGYHTSPNLYIVADYLAQNKNLVGLNQLFRLVCSTSFCFCHTPDAGKFQYKLKKTIEEISLEDDNSGVPIFTKEDVEQLFSICKSHREIISTWERLKKQEEWGMTHAYAGVRDARRELYHLDYEEIDLDSPPGGERSYYGEMKLTLIMSRILNKRKQ